MVHSLNIHTIYHWDEIHLRHLQLILIIVYIEQMYFLKLPFFSAKARVFPVGVTSQCVHTHKPIKTEMSHCGRTLYIDIFFIPAQSLVQNDQIIWALIHLEQVT